MLRNLYATQGLHCREDDPHIKTLCTRRDKKQTSLVAISRSNKKATTQLYIPGVALLTHISKAKTRGRRRKSFYKKLLINPEEGNNSIVISWKATNTWNAVHLTGEVMQIFQNFLKNNFLCRTIDIDVTF